MAARLPLTTATLLAAMVLASSARADDKAECVAASEEGQSLVTQRHFVAARERFVACARAGCPTPIVKDCSVQLERVDASIATIILVARAGDDELRDVRVTADGAPIATHLDGRALSIDPGPHKFVFTTPEGVPRVVDTVVEEGARLKHVTAVFEAAAKPIVPMKRAPVSLLAWVLGGVGLASLGVGVGLGVDTVARQHSLYTASARDAFELEQHFVDVALGVGVVALGVAIVLVVTRPSVPVKHVGFEGLRVTF